MSEYFSEADFELPIQLTEEEIQQKSAEYFANQKKMNRASMALVNAKHVFKSTTDPLKKRNAVLEQQIDDGFEMRKFRAIEMVNEDRATMEYYDAEHHDVLVHSRPLTPTEKVQFKIKFSRSKQEA
ncbi:hypothetical protein [Dyadobacter sp. OTU695]|uniref:hypothetical protein n=1 Tax=Dyadobacter sp. OTU695 TaxID=3043860 RepID=UPI00313E9587